MTRIYYLSKNGIPFYIGKTKGDWRKSIHIRNYTNIEYIEIDEVEDNEWKFWESYWIEQFKQWGFVLENKNKGGGGPSSYTKEQKQKMRKPHKEGTGEKISKKLKGRKRGPMSEKTKQKIREVRTGKPQPNISKAHKGRKITWSHKIGDSLRGKPKNYISGKRKPILQYSLAEELIQEFNSATEAGTYLNQSGNTIADCAAGRQKTAYGYKWEYLKI